MQVDALTILCTVLTIYGGYAMFVSNKPVNFGGVMLLIVLALSTTQAVMGFHRARNNPVEDKSAGGDVVDLMRSVFTQVTARGTGWF